ncbi:3-isopropylmalate dehydratase large subunit [Fusibacter ferrireducens]|uniref:3-isopropylmalate dehydratase large subunit n=1 Tax=Fusibacter ferrireducens TaxID=2785058 RepID=A0ABR9ZZW5_9FIRM|nr:3-isopropylmalate dehydratase large subunit [Fusibacter ferrireducens]MBF4695999.1 3-isopropylmalate dehydratase large subunit [Fusibacter ferrireducens]
MGMTMTQKILAAHCQKTHLTAGEFVHVDLDMVLGNDITAPVAIDSYDQMEVKRVFDTNKIALVPDHFTPNKDIETANLAKKMRQFAKDNQIANYFEIGQMGIEHALLPEKGLVVSGDVVIGADSHTCTYGALGAFSTGIGSTDMAVGMATGKCWFKVPTAIKVVLTGELQDWSSGKDVILHLIGLIGVDGARYQSLEFTGEGLSSLTMDDRFTIANMAIEAGAKNGIFEVDERTIAYIEAHSERAAKVYRADSDAEYAQVIEINLSEIEPTVAFPHLPENTKTFNEIPEINIDQVIVGSCTNGRFDDLKVTAEILKGHKVHPNVRMIIIPATQKIYLDAVKAGYVEIFINAGAVVSTPTCGPCLGGHMGILGANERAVATTNRNFVGRMGHKSSEIYLASPAVATVSAIEGKLSSPRLFYKGE